MNKEQHIEAAAKEYGYKTFEDAWQKAGGTQMWKIVSKAMDSWAEDAELKIIATLTSNKP